MRHVDGVQRLSGRPPPVLHRQPDLRRQVSRKLASAKLGTHTSYTSNGRCEFEDSSGEKVSEAHKTLDLVKGREGCYRDILVSDSVHIVFLFYIKK